MRRTCADRLSTRAKKETTEQIPLTFSSQRVPTSSRSHCVIRSASFCLTEPSAHLNATVDRSEFSNISRSNCARFCQTYRPPRPVFSFERTFAFGMSTAGHASAGQQLRSALADRGERECYEKKINTLIWLRRSLARSRLLFSSLRCSATKCSRLRSDPVQRSTSPLRSERRRTAKRIRNKHVINDIFCAPDSPEAASLRPMRRNCL